MPHSILIAATSPSRRDFIAAQLDADGFTVYTTDTATGAIAKLSAQAIDVLLLAELERRADLTLLREIRGDRHERIHPAQLAVTLGDVDELATLRAYEAGSDHHLATGTGYVVLRAVIETVLRRSEGNVRSRHLHIGTLHIDTAARTAAVAGTPVKTSRLEFELLCQLASDPTRVFSKRQLMRAIWGYDDSARSRTLDSHAARLRSRLRDAGADDLVKNVWGTGYALRSSEPGR